jgi:hypothetical protein
VRWLRRRPTVEWQAKPGVKLATGLWEKSEAGWAAASGGMPLENPVVHATRNITNLQTWIPALWRAARPLISDLLTVFVPALLLGALYWGRNFVVCGPLDVVCGHWHNQIVVGQPTTREWIALHGWWGSEASLLNRFFVFTFDSFWGVFGWMGVFMDRRVYVALLLYSAGLGIGAIGAAIRRPAFTTFQRHALTLLGVSGLITLAVYLYYNMSFVQHQGRYLFPALIPLGLAAAVGIEQWVKWIVQGVGRMGQGSKQWAEFALTLAPIVLMAALDLFALYRFIIPSLR